MNRDEIIRALRNHRTTCAKVEMLRNKIEGIERDIALAEMGGLIQSPKMTGMPKGTGISKPTEKAALNIKATMHGEESLKVAEIQLNRELNTKRCVEILLSCLSDKERFVVENHLVAGLSWTEIGRDHEKEYRCFLARRTAQDLQAKALKKMEKVCVAA